MIKPIREIHFAFQAAIDALEDISRVMPQMKELATKWSGRLRAFVALTGDAEEGELWRLSMEVSQSACALAELCQRTRVRCDAARLALVAVRRGCREADVDRRVDTLIGTACATATAQLELIEQTIREAQRRFASEQEQLLELALSHDTPPRTRAIAQATILRARGT